MTRPVRGRFWVELSMAMASMTLLGLTVLWPDWIERISPWEPDGGDGSLEWALVAGCLLVTVATALLAGREWSRAGTLATSLGSRR